MAKWDEEELADPDVKSFVEEVVKRLDDPAKGIARQYVTKGYESLSPKQKAVLVQQVLNKYTTERCKRCSQSIPWSEQEAAIDNSGYCSWCVNQIEKSKEE